MELEKKTALLWFISLMISVCLLLAGYAGWMPAFQYALVSFLAIVCWLRFSPARDPFSGGLVSRYILSLVLFLLLAIVEYASGFHVSLVETFRRFLVPGLPADYTHWFLVFVCFPVSFLLVGGYYLTRGKAVGLLFTWWAFFYFLTEALVHLRVELWAPSTYHHYGYLGSFIAMGVFLLSVYGMLSLLREGKPTLQKQGPELTRRQMNLWSVLFVCLVLVYAVTLYEQAGLLPVGIIVGSMMGGMMGWRKTTARNPADPYKVVPLYLLLQALFYFHVGEEVLTHFGQAIAKISGHPWNDTGFNFLITLVGPLIWIFAGWSLWKRQPFGNFVLWFLIVGMILGEPTHILVFPVMRMVQQGVPYQYFPGMYTALFAMIPAILALGVILRDHRMNKERR